MAVDPGSSAPGKPAWTDRVPGGRPFAYFWGARSLSLVGDYAFRVAFIAYVITATNGSALALALANAVLLVPALVFYLLGGVVGDRASRRAIMIISDVARAAVCLGAMAAVLADAPVAAIVILATALSIGDGFFGPASFGLMAEIVPSQRLLGANSALSVSQQVGLVVGPMLGGLLVGLQGPAVGFAFNAATFGLSTVLVALIRYRRAVPVAAAQSAGGNPGSAPPGAADEPSAPAEPVEPVAAGGPVRALLTETRAGLAYVRAQPWLLISFAVGALANAVFAGNLDVSVPLVVASEGVGKALNLGVFYTLEGVGAVLGAVVLARVTVRRPGPVMFQMLGLMAAALAAVGIVGNSTGTYVAAVAYGVGLHYFNSLFGTVLQRGVPTELMSRVSSVAQLGFSGLMPVGTLLMGPLIVGFGVRPTLVMTGALICLLSLAAAVSRPIQQVGREETR